MDVRPTERAQQLKALKDQHGTLEATAELAGLSAASVSRYLQLLELPDDIQRQVDAGELPINQPLAALRRKSVEKGPRITALSPLHNQLLDELARTGFATLAQLAAYSGKSQATIRTALQALTAFGLIDVNRDFKPHAFYLTARACELRDIPKPKHVFSANAIHQRLLRNQIELAMRDINPTARFVSRNDCWSMGLFPAVAEHLVTFYHAGESRYALVLIDDYAMTPSRVPHVLRRPHDENKTKVASTGNHVMTWLDRVDTVLVYSTNPQFRQALETVLGSLDNTFNVTLTVRDIEPLWEFV